MLLIATLIAGGLLSCFIKVKFKVVYNLARVYFFVAMLVGVSSWLFFCAAFNNTFISRVLQLAISCFGLMGYLILGYLLMNIFLTLTLADTDERQAGKITSLTQLGICILTGFTFITQSFWKNENIGKMCCFFSTSFL